MAVYAIGDIQGCADELERLLAALHFDPARDQVWFCGDLVNRGPGSLRTLRLVRSLGDAAVTVLGNHDLHLLAVASGVRPPRPHKGDTLEAVLEAPDRDDILHWLRHQPLVHWDDELRWLMVHAGLPPQWTAQQAVRLGGEVSAALRRSDHAASLARMYGNEPDLWRDDLAGDDRLRFVINCLTRMRYCTAQGRLEFGAKGEPGTQGDGLIPWFQAPGRRSADCRIVFGHWSTLGGYEGDNVIALDTGCVWGGCLSAVRLDRDTPVWTQVPCPGEQPTESDA